KESSDPDSGWKSRISFPSKKKAKEREEEEAERAEESALYNQVNRDLRTVPQESAKQNAPAQPEETANVGAMAAELPKDGLPKDVTLEEIAAIAAAAAQVQMAAAAKAEDQISAPEVPQPVAAVAVGPVEARTAVEEVPSPVTFADVRREEQ